MPVDHFINISFIQVDTTSASVASRLNYSIIAADTSTPKNISYFNESMLGPCVEYFNESLEDNAHITDRNKGTQVNTQQETPGFNVVQGRCKTFGKYNSDRFFNVAYVQADTTSTNVADRLNYSLIAADTSTPKNISYFNESMLGPCVEYFNESLEDGEQTTANWIILYDINGNAKNSIQPQQGWATIE